MSSWKPLVDGATDKPGFTSKESAAASKLMRQHCKKDATKLGEQLAALVAEHGSLEEVEAQPTQRVVNYESAEEFARQAPAMIEAGWRVAGQSAQDGHVNVRRSALRIATGGVLLGGLSRTKGTVTVTWERG